MAPAQNTIECWRVDLDQADDHVATLTGVLADDEQERANRFVFAHDRRRFVVTRACLRVLLGAAEGRPAASIRFAYGERGKPSLAAGAGVSPLHFSVSHSQDLAVIALARHAPLGVDVEALRPLPNAADLACRYFTAAEADTIATAPAAERLLTFFLCWTRKEAFAKARGDGLARARRRDRWQCRGCRAMVHVRPPVGTGIRGSGCHARTTAAADPRAPRCARRGATAPAPVTAARRAMLGAAQKSQRTSR